MLFWNFYHPSSLTVLIDHLAITSLQTTGFQPFPARPLLTISNGYFVTILYPTICFTAKLPQMSSPWIATAKRKCLPNRGCWLTLLPLAFETPSSLCCPALLDNYNLKRWVRDSRTPYSSSRDAPSFRVYTLDEDSSPRSPETNLSAFLLALHDAK